jgi:hypothetical protein
MNQPVNTRGYDLFKAIVVLILLIPLIWLVLTGAKSTTPITLAPASTNTPTSAPPVYPTVQPTATSMPVQASATPMAENFMALLPTSTATDAPATEATSDPPQPTAALSVTPGAPAPVPGQVPVDCPLALPTRLKVGDTVRVTSNLNMRSSAGIGTSRIQTNPPGTQLTIIGGPVCEPYQGSAYLWWQVLSSADKSGWSAEGSLTENFYFLEPNP